MRWRLALALLVAPAWAQIELYTPVMSRTINYPTAWNPYMFDLGLPLDTSISPVCNVTDQPTCWSSGTNAVWGYDCENCCMGASDKFPEGCFPFMDLPDWWESDEVNPELYFEEYCCKGKLKPNFDALEQTVVGLSEAEQVRPPSCEKGKEAEAIFWRELLVDQSDPKKGYDPNKNEEAYVKISEELGAAEAQGYCFDYLEGYTCESCCFNVGAHPVTFYSDRQPLVNQNPCWISRKTGLNVKNLMTSNVETMILDNPLINHLPAGSFLIMSPYEMWEECCMQKCPPGMEVAMCVVMENMVWIIMGFFFLVVGICTVTEHCLINNYLCFKPLEDGDAIEELEKPAPRRFTQRFSKGAANAAE